MVSKMVARMGGRPSGLGPGVADLQSLCLKNEAQERGSGKRCTDVM